MQCSPTPPAPRLSRTHAPRSRAIASGLLVSVLAALLAACAGTAPKRTASTSPSTAWAEGATATVEGRVRAVDTAPWAYDGNAVVKLDSDAHGAVELQFPARWNLCRAADIGDLQALAPGTRVRATGAVSAPATLTICEDASHGLQRLD